MSDLIDLNSPDTNKVLRKELASPLIPPPAGTGSPSTIANGLPNLITGEKRDSLDNNPFDQVFKETEEYVRKKEDPFEMVLEKVTGNKKSKRRSVEFKDDFIPKNTRHGEVLKMNKTLDDSMIEMDLNTSRSCFGESSIIEDLINNDLLNENENGYNIPEIAINAASPLNSSILNHSAMNDSLIESNTSAKETAIRSLVAKRVSMCIQKGIMEAGSMVKPNQQLQLVNCRRSLSQSDRLSPKKFEFRQRSHSIIDLKRKLSRSERSTLSSMPSIEFDDQFNKGFLQEQYSGDSSVFFDLSNISEITRLTSVSSAYNSSISLFSNGTMNQAFIQSDSSPSQVLPAITLSPANTRKNIRSISTSTIGSTNASENVNNDISDLLKKFKALKVKLTQSSASEEDNTKEDISEESNHSKELKSSVNENEVKETLIEKIKAEDEFEERKDVKEDEKLIDVDVFIPADESKSSRGKSSFSDSSSDSVFTKSETDKSILNEARKLAKTFEEMVDDKSNSSGYDLLSSNTHFDFDQLPDSDDDMIENNLIDLPPSPSKPEAPPNSPTEIENESSSTNESQKDLNRVKEIEMEFIEPKDPEKKIMATSLLLELEKLIKTEKNPDAEKLLNELEKVLGVQWENNTDLLKTYLQNAKSNIQVSENNTENKNVEKEMVENKNVENENAENKDVDNNNIRSIEDIEVRKNETINSTEENQKRRLNRKNTFVLKKEKPEIEKMQHQPGLRKSFSRSLDSSSKVELSSEKIVVKELASSQPAIKNTIMSPKQKLKSRLGLRKRFSSDPNTLNPELEKKQTDSITLKNIQDKVFLVPEKQTSTVSNMANAVRNKMKQKLETGVSKKGPMKATIPFGSLQRRPSFGKKATTSVILETPTKTSPEKSTVFTATSSTPNTSITSILFKKSKSKPVASSTPDYKEPKTLIIKPPTPRKRNFSCNISPVPVVSKSINEKLNLMESPKGGRLMASPPKRPSTPKARRPPRTPSSGIPKYSPRPVMQRRRSLNDLNNSAGRSQSPQLVPNTLSLRKTPVSTKKIEKEPPKSPLRNINKKDLIVKPLNLISKLRRRGNNYSEAEKENFS